MWLDAVTVLWRLPSGAAADAVEFSAIILSFNLFVVDPIPT